MESKFWLLRISCLLLAISFAAAQVATPPRPVTTNAVLTVTEDLWPNSLSTATITGGGVTTTVTFDAAFTLSTTITADGAKATYKGDPYYGLEFHDVAVVPGYNVSLLAILENPVCYLATSSQWSLLPRIVFYISLVFALVARKHEWLIGGALAAALSYSSLAALQMAFQVWTHQAVAELDLLPMTGILGASCVIAVPLMNWSSTIQRLGLEDFESESPEGEHVKQEFKKKEDYGSTRIVLVFWNIVVAIGFLAAFAGIIALLQGADWISFTTALNVDTISCVPPNGKLDTTAGQLGGWDSFWLTAEFVEQNNCIDPCSSSSTSYTLFRSASELQLFSMEDVDHFIEQKHVSKRAQRNITFVDVYYGFLLFLLPFIILQGIMHMLLFWRSTPQKARWRIYRGMLELRNINLDIAPPTSYTRLAFWLALLFYIFAMLVLIIAPAAFILTIVATEIALSWTPQSETNAHVDQWGVFAILIFVLLAALISRVAPGARRTMKAAQLDIKYAYYTHQIRRLTDPHYKHDFPEPKLHRLTWLDRLIILWKHMFERSSSSGDRKLWESVTYLVTDLILLLRYEWHLTGLFWSHPGVKPQRRGKEKSGKWKRKAPHSFKEDDRREQVRWIKQRKEQVRQVKKQFKELVKRPVQEKHPQVPFPSSASSFQQGYKDEEALRTTNTDNLNIASEQNFDAHSDATPLLSSNASGRRRNSSNAPSLPEEMMNQRSPLIRELQEPQQPSQLHLARQPIRNVRQHSWRSTNDSIPRPTMPNTYSHRETQAISPVSSTMSLSNDQAHDASYAQVSEINSLRQQQSPGSSNLADQRHDDIPMANISPNNIPRKNIPNTNQTYTATSSSNGPRIASLPNDTPHANNNPYTNALYSKTLPELPATTSGTQSSESLPKTQAVSESHNEHDPEPEQHLSQSHSVAASLHSEDHSHSDGERSQSPTPSINQRISIVHELPPIDVDSSFTFHF